MKNFFEKSKERSVKKYLTISQMAKLRDVNINSLRYYEKLGILIPAYIDTDTKYRYYRPDQLFMLDIILLCINLGIPLKDLPSYIDSNYVFGKELLEDGRKLAERKIEDISLGLKKIEYMLKRQEDNKKYAEIQNIYSREYDERFFVTIPYHGDLRDSMNVESVSAQLFTFADKNNLTPVFSMSFILQPNNTEEKILIAYEIITPKKDFQIISVPKTEFECCKVCMNYDDDYLEYIKERFKHKQINTAIISLFVTDQYSSGNKDQEIQVI